MPLSISLAGNPYPKVGVAHPPNRNMPHTLPFLVTDVDSRLQQLSQSVQYSSEFRHFPYITLLRLKNLFFFHNIFKFPDQQLIACFALTQSANHVLMHFQLHLCGQKIFKMTEIMQDWSFLIHCQCSKFESFAMKLWFYSEVQLTACNPTFVSFRLLNGLQ